MHYQINNDLVFYSLFISSGVLLTGLFIKSYFYPTVIETPYSPPTFNLTLQQLREIETPPLPSNSSLVQDILDNEGDFNDIFKDILTEEEYNQYQTELLDPDNDFSENLQAIFDSLDIF